MKTFSIPDVFTEAEIQHAQNIFTSFPDHLIAGEIEKKVVQPAIIRIEKKLGQAMDSMYVAYAFYYVLSKSQTKT